MFWESVVWGVAPSKLLHKEGSARKSVGGLLLARTAKAA